MNAGLMENVVKIIVGSLGFKPEEVKAKVEYLVKLAQAYTARQERMEDAVEESLTIAISVSGKIDAIQAHLLGYAPVDYAAGIPIVDFNVKAVGTPISIEQFKAVGAPVPMEQFEDDYQPLGPEGPDWNKPVEAKSNG